MENQNKIQEIMSKSTEEITNFIMGTNNAYFQFQVAGSTNDYDFFFRLNEETRKEEVENAVVQMPDYVLQELLEYFFEGKYD